MIKVIAELHRPDRIAADECVSAETVCEFPHKASAETSRMWPPAPGRSRSTPCTRQTYRWHRNPRRATSTAGSGEKSSFRRPTSGSLPPLFRRQKYLISGPSRTLCPHACLAIPRLYISVAKASVLPGVHGHLVSPDYDPYWCEGESYRPACDKDQTMRVCCP